MTRRLLAAYAVAPWGVVAAIALAEVAMAAASFFRLGDGSLVVAARGASHQLPYLAAWCYIGGALLLPLGRWLDSHHRRSLPYCVPLAAVFGAIIGVAQAMMPRAGWELRSSSGTPVSMSVLLVTAVGGAYVAACCGAVFSIALRAKMLERGSLWLALVLSPVGVLLWTALNMADGLTLPVPLFWLVNEPFEDFILMPVESGAWIGGMLRDLANTYLAGACLLPLYYWLKRRQIGGVMYYVPIAMAWAIAARTMAVVLRSGVWAMTSEGCRFVVTATDIWPVSTAGVGAICGITFSLLVPPRHPSALHAGSSRPVPSPDGGLDLPLHP